MKERDELMINCMKRGFKYTDLNEICMKTTYEERDDMIKGVIEKKPDTKMMYVSVRYASKDVLRKIERVLVKSFREICFIAGEDKKLVMPHVGTKNNSGMLKK
jgi:hypothetical protein